MAEIDAFLREWGLWIYGLLFLYCALKSGALPFFAAIAAEAGSLDLAMVALASFAGGYLGDEARFAVARRYGSGLFLNRPRLRRALNNAAVLMQRYGPAYIFMYRYPKGMRTIGALPVGLSDMTWGRFTLLNAASALLWAGLLTGAGYLFGAAIRETVADNWGTASVLMLLLFILVTWLAWRRLRRLGQVEAGL